MYDPEEMARRGRLGAFVTNSRYDRRSLTEKARAAFRARFAHEPDPDAAMRAHMADLARRGARLRRERARAGSAPKGGSDAS